METKRIDALLQAMARAGGSALHLESGRPPLLRVQRRLLAADDQPVTADDVEELVRDLLFSDHRDQLLRLGHVEVLYVARNGCRHRVTVAEVGGRCSVVMRPVPEVPPQLADLDLPEQVAAFTRCRSGLVVVAGFFGSGKSTTLAAIVEALNQDPARHIVTIEDSIQFVHQNGPALLHQREVGTHVASVAEGVHQAMSIGVDAIVIAQIPDAPALDAAIAAAESGCLVFAGVESGSVSSAFADLAALAAAEERPRLRTRLARALRGAMAQSLLQRTHRSGRVPVVEILVSSPAVRNAVRAGRLHELPAIMQRCRGLGMQTTDIALRGLLGRHLVAAEEALLHATDRDEVLGRAPAR